MDARKFDTRLTETYTERFGTRKDLAYLSYLVPV